MESKNIDKKIDETAETAKRVVATVHDTRRAAGELAGAVIADAQTAFTQASKKGEHRLTERLTEAAHRLEETVTKLANRAQEWAGKAASRSQRAGRKPSDKVK